MGEFFNGWRRKTGLVMLAMACAVAGMWMRSQQMRDSLQVRIADNAAYIFISNESELVWQSLRHEAMEKVRLRRFAILQTSVSENRRHFAYGRRRTTKEDYSNSVIFRTVDGTWQEDDPPRLQLGDRHIGSSFFP